MKLFQNNLKRKLNTTPFSKSVSTKSGELLGWVVQEARVQDNHKWAGFPELWIKFWFEEEVISVPLRKTARFLPPTSGSSPWNAQSGEAERTPGGCAFQLGPPWTQSGFPGGSEVKASARNAGDLGSIPGSGRSPGEGNGNPLPGESHGRRSLVDYSPWVAKSRTRLSDFTHSFKIIILEYTLQFLVFFLYSWFTMWY